MNPLTLFFHTKPHSWSGCRPLSAVERMEQYNRRHAADMRERENEGAAYPRMQLRNGEYVLVSLRGKVNQLPGKGKS